MLTYGTKNDTPMDIAYFNVMESLSMKNESNNANLLYIDVKMR